MSTESTANATQVGGAHYKVAIEHWDFVANRGLGYFEGQVTKYVTRWRKKNGVQDLQKARHFLSKLIELRHAGLEPWTSPHPNTRTLPLISLDDYALANDLRPKERGVVALVSEWRGAVSMLDAALTMIDELMAEGVGAKVYADG